jgi:hypothetical protein
VVAVDGEIIEVELDDTSGEAPTLSISRVKNYIKLRLGTTRGKKIIFFVLLLLQMLRLTHLPSVGSQTNDPGQFYFLNAEN